MLHIRWKDSYEVGVPEIDAEHREIIDTYNHLVDAWRRDNGMVEPTMIIHELAGRFRYHSMREEALLEDYDLPDPEAHKAEHRAMIDDFDEIERRFLTEETSAAKEQSLKLLRKKLLEHTVGLDRALFRQLRKRSGPGAGA